ncbi:RES family NAD+ phosphorylase [Dyadobacter arcticus]|uniref:RES domain-containing protein n=1 Tax=Dyadobacter arcticus TaxID=1078754 RepID=A0ABX0UPI8_9BACT|nr:RES family NAD+ phosphorylase [Dyadobacter arcticus]NIJ54044.1 RES domain-containing protein [Dyadobacter arcticus]
MRSEFQEDLSGIGAFYHGGRWNSPRNYMLYTSSHRSLAMLEVLVHWNKTTPPPNYVIVVLFVPDAMVSTQAPYAVENWQEDQQWTKDTGDEWLSEGRTLLFRVPSVVIKSEHNFLINPLHANASSIKIVDVEPFSFDKRLFILSK